MDVYFVISDTEFIVNDRKVLVVKCERENIRNVVAQAKSQGVKTVTTDCETL